MPNFCSSVDNDLLSSTIACPLRFGDVLVFHERNVLESASLAKRNEFEQLLVVTGSHVRAVKLWCDVRQLEGTGVPPRHGPGGTWLVDNSHKAAKSHTNRY